MVLNNGDIQTNSLYYIAENIMQNVGNIAKPLKIFWDIFWKSLEKDHDSLALHQIILVQMAAVVGRVDYTESYFK